MKKLIAISAVSLAALTSAASAMVTTSDLNTYAPNVDAAALTEAEVNTILSIIHSGDSEGEKRQQVQAFLK